MADETPQHDADAAPWWEGVAAGELRYQRCDDCAKVVFYPRAVCVNCLSSRLTWQVSEGRGVVYATTVVHRAPDPRLADETPYVLALVDLDEGFRMLTRIVEADPEQVRVGDPVALVFGDGLDGQPLPYFRPR